MAAKWTGFFVTGIIGVPGDRVDEVVKTAARIAARGFSRLLIKEDADLRGRRKGEVAQIVRETVNRESPDRGCAIVLDEVEAFADALAALRENEIVVIFYDKLAPILEILEQNGAVPAATIENFDTPKPKVVQV
jgi:cyanophycin synthetase